jgi:hypothetical protein
VSAPSSAAGSPRSTARRCAASASSRPWRSTTPSSGTSATSLRTSLAQRLSR